MVDFANTSFIRHALAISTGTIIIISFIKGCGIIKQGIDIWKKKSGKNVSPIFFFYNFFYFLLFLMYGLEENDHAITISGYLCFLYLPILIGLGKYRGFSKKEIYFVALMSLVIPASFFFDRSQIIFLFSGAAVIAIFDQTKKIWKEKKFGALSVQYLQTFLAAAIFWGLYYLMTKNWLLGTLNLAEIMVLTTALILERKWHPKQK